MKYAKAFIIMAAVFLLQPFFSALIPALGRVDILMSIMFITLFTCSEKQALPYIVSGLIFLFLKDVAVGLFPGVSLFAASAVIGYAVFTSVHINSESPGFVFLAGLGEAVIRQLILFITYKAAGYPESIFYAAGQVYINIIAETVVIMLIYMIFIHPKIADRRSRFFK